MKSVQELHAKAEEMQQRGEWLPEEIAFAVVDHACGRPGCIRHVNNQDGTITLRFEDTTEVIRFANGRWLYESPQ